MHTVFSFKWMNFGRASVLLALLAIGVASLVPPDAAALSLGRSRGTPLIGKPLDISVMGTLESAQEIANAQCFEADVFYGDTRLPAGTLRISVDKLGAANDIAIRIRSTQPVDEPVVTVFLKATCQQLSTRRYVLLSEASTEEFSAPSAVAAPRAVPFTPYALAAAPVLAVPRIAAPEVNLPKSGATPESNAAPSAREERRLLREQLRAERKAREAERKANAAQRVTAARSATASERADTASLAIPAIAAPAATGKASKKSEASKTKGARLELDSADFFAGERSPSLRASSELLSPLATDPQQRLAAAALWKSLQADPSEALQANNRLSALESELATMRSDGKRQQAALQSLSADLATARSERYVNGFSIAMLFLALAAIAAAAYAWVRLGSTGGKTRAGSPWWAGKQAADREFDSEDKPFTPPPKTAQLQPRKSAADMGFVSEPGKFSPEVTSPLSPMDQWEALDSSSQAGFDAPSGMAAARARLQQDMKQGDMLPISSVDFAPSIPGMPRTVNAEELFDVQQQAEFFVSLGQHTQAIEILRSHIREYPETSAMAYLDLFELYHTLKLSHNYETLRADFNRAFNGKIPPFEQYNEVGRGLEYYPRALTRIQLLWPSQRVLEVIEESVFRRHAETAEEEGGQSGFDLLAYRELLMLHAIIKDVHVYEKSNNQSKNSGVKAGTHAPSVGPQGAKKRKLDAPASDFLSTDLDQLPTFDQSAHSLSPSLIEVVPPSANFVGFGDDGGVMEFENMLDVPDAKLQDEIVFPRSSKRMGLDINLETIDPSPLAAPAAAQAQEDMAIDFDMDDALVLPKKPNKPA